MCGIAGFVSLSRQQGKDQLVAQALRMGEAIRYRGPDAADAWADPKFGIALAHRRLSIVDLSEAGNQPMASSCGRFVMVYNGEVYNAEDLRAELTDLGRGRYRGHSDTEVILEGFGHWGITATLKRLIGMFAMAVWDCEAEKLFLIRDRLGIKPVYWSHQPGGFLFGSEMKALYAHPEWRGDLDRNALSSFLRHNYIPAPSTAWREAHKLEPGTVLVFDPNSGQSPEISRFWSMEEVVRQGREAPFQGSDADAVDELERLLEDAVTRRMVADVPLGAFLSGGIDSSTVVALMQKNTTRPVKTFSIGFEEDGYNEAQHASVVAGTLKTDHTELYVSSEEARNVIPKLAGMYDEPFADSSQIPTFLVSEMTRKHVTVALSGDGGDELFAGYNRYVQASAIGGRVTGKPMWMRRSGARLLRSLSPQFWDRLFQMVPASKRPPQAGDKVHKFAGILTEDEDGFYRRLVSHWDRPDDIVKRAQEKRGLLWNDGLRDFLPDRIDRMRFLDICTYLPDDILTKVDRASMAVSLEARVPILDHRVVEFAWRLPTNMLIKDGRGKWPLREILYRYVPREIVDRPKMGFGVPVGNWLRGPLKEWGAELLNPAAIGKYGILNAEPIWEKWKEHQAGHRNWQYHLWDVLMLQAWCSEYSS